MKAKSLLSAAILFATVLTAFPSPADPPAASSQVQLVGLINAPPFAMQDTEGNWEGIAVDLWRHAADDLGIRYQLIELPIPTLIASLEEGKLLAVLTVTATAEREMQLDFSHPYYSSGLAIAVKARGEGSSWLDLPEQVFSLPIAKIMGLLFGLLFIAAILVWICERRANPEHFDLSPLKGIPASFWWACVTATTVGYGDKAPKTAPGRVIGVLWMFTAVVLVALFTAQVTASLTVTTLTGLVRGPADLPRVKVGVIEQSQPQSVLRTKFGVNALSYPDFTRGLEALERGEISAFVAAAPVLRYEIANNFPATLVVVGEPFLRADYVFAFPLGSDIRKRVNRSILAYIETDEWRTLLTQYLGAGT